MIINKPCFLGVVFFSTRGCTPYIFEVCMGLWNAHTSLNRTRTPPRSSISRYRFKERGRMAIGRMLKNDLEQLDKE